MQTKLTQICNNIKLKNPSLIQQIAKQVEIIKAQTIERSEVAAAKKGRKTKFD